MSAREVGLLPGREPFRPAWALAGLALLVVCLLLRSWTNLTRPGLYVEDAILFNWYYGHTRPLSDIFTSHIGQNYLTLIPDFLAWSYAWADVRWQPFLYQWSGFALAVASVATVSFSGLVRNRLLLVVCPLALGLTGLNHLYYYNTLIYTMYTGVLMLLALLLYPPPATARSFVLQAVLLTVLPWSGPYSLLALPVVLFLFVCTANRTRQVLLLIAGISTLAYWATVSGSTVQLTNLLRPWVPIQYLQTVFDKIFFFDFTKHLPMWYGFFLLLVIASLSWLLRRDREYLRQTSVMLGLIFASLLLFFLSVKLAQYISTSNCHRVVASFFWVLFLVVTADRLLGRCPLRSPWPLVCAGLLLTLVVLDNRRHPDKGWARPMSALPVYLETVRFYEGQGLAEKNQAVCLHLPSARAMYPGILVGHRGIGTRLLLPQDAEIVRGRRFVCPHHRFKEKRE
ncbi:MAG: hypothetical protein RBT36_01510 [Desulfobulbus sp.]|jgi:hypothetical protein|nr:hypothetical protein [Desulfobulbus sp.]